VLETFTYFSQVTLYYTDPSNVSHSVSCYSKGETKSGIWVQVGTPFTLTAYCRTSTPKVEFNVYIEGVGSITRLTQYNASGSISDTMTPSSTGYRNYHVFAYDKNNILVDGCTFEMQVTSERVQHLLRIYSPDGSGAVSPSPGPYYYDEGTPVTISASPSSGWGFSYWIIDGATNTNSTVTLTMDRDHEAKAYFYEIKPNYDLTVVVNPPGSGSVSPSGGTYASGTQVTLTAKPNPGWVFTGWSDGASGNSISVTIIMDGNKKVTANFGYSTAPSVDFYINGQKVGNNSSIYLGKTTMDFKAVSTQELSSVSVVISGSANATVSLSSSDNKKTWTGSWTAPGAGTYNISVKASYPGGQVQVCSVDFAYGQVSAPPGKTALVFNISPGEGGSVLVTDPKGQTVVDENTAVTVQAFPNAGYRFKGWGGDVMGKDARLTFMAKGGSMMIIATFEKEVPLAEKAVGLVKENIFKILTAVGLVMVVSGEVLERRRRI
jgi:uncharacterized repeat protein (TIGR02543 family)